MNDFTGIAAGGSQHAATEILIVLGALVGVVVVGALLWEFTTESAEHIRGVPRFIRDFTGQFIGILVGGVVLGLILTAVGLNALISFLIALCAAIVFIIWVSG